MFEHLFKRSPRRLIPLWLMYGLVAMCPFFIGVAVVDRDWIGLTIGLAGGALIAWFVGTHFESSLGGVNDEGWTIFIRRTSKPTPEAGRTATALVRGASRGRRSSARDDQAPEEKPDSSDRRSRPIVGRRPGKFY